VSCAPIAGAGCHVPVVLLRFDTGTEGNHV
jgi:hypothetical protein